MKELFCIKKSHHSRGSVLFRWDPSNKYLASVGANRRVNVFDRSGAQIDEFALSGKPVNAPLQIEWDKEGENLAVLCDGHSVVSLWNVYSKAHTSLETNLKDPSFMSWSRTGPQLAVGTCKGNLLLYNSDSKKSQLLAGKHSKKITCGQWNLDNKLALASLDRTMSINEASGELLEQAKLKYDPVDIQFNEQKMDDAKPSAAGGSGGQGKENTVSINMGHQTILMYNMTDQDNPVELAFQPKYGEIATYKWFGDGYMMVGFSKGYIIAISTHMKEIGEELQSLKIHEQSLVDVAYNAGLNKLATCGDDGVRVVDMQDWKELKSEHKEFTREEGDPERMEWTKDGQILSVATNGGYVFNFLMSIPVLSAHYQSKMVYLSSLRHVSVIDVAAEQHGNAAPVVSLEIAIEPSFLALGPEHVAVGMNNHCFFYTWNNAQLLAQQEAGRRLPMQQPLAVHEREYLGSVKAVALNDVYAAVLLDNGRVNLHLIVNDPENERDSRIFPAQDEKDFTSTDADTRVTSMALTADFLIYATNKGSVHHFFLKDWAQVVEHRHEGGAITALYSNPLGTRIVFTDASSRAFMFSPVDDHKFEVAGYPAANGAEKVLFDQSDPNVFVVVDPKHSRSVTTFAYASQTTRGPAVQKLPAVTKLTMGFAHVVLCIDGQIHGQKSSGALTSLPLASHDSIHYAQQPAPVRGGRGNNRSSDRLRTALTQLLSLNRLKQAWELALMLKSRDCWSQLAKKAMEQLDTDLSIRCFRELKDTAMVLALQEVRDVEDKDLLAGHLLLLQGDYATAQKLFLASSQPVQALQMRRDLLNWDMALKLAAQLAPAEIPSICREYAASLEVKGDYQQALAMYQRAIQEDQVSAASAKAGEHNQALSKEHLRVCNGGIARMTLRVGDLQRGRSLAMASGDKILLKDCAAILEQMKQYPDAADMYVVAEQFERAASIYNQTLQFNKSAPLMDRITTPKIHLQYAKAKEAAKEYATAAAAYEKARDLDSVIRLNLQHLDNPDKAFQIVRVTKSAEGAALVADYCRQHNNFQAAIEFLLMAKRGEEAFALAKAHTQMPAYCLALGDDGTQEEYAAVAAYFEEARDWARAGEYFARIGDYARSIKLYLLSDNPAHIDAAIGVVKKAQGHPGAEVLVRQLHSFLIGEVDGKVKDLNFIFRLYMAIGEYAQAATTAILIATQEQSVGQYALAHQILFAMHQDLVRERLPIPAELRRNLVLLHSYTLAKKMTAAKAHDLAARMLIRVAKSISKFPAHVVPILTSTVIECQRAGLKKDSLEYAKILLRPEHKPKVSPQFLKPIESFVRRPPSQEELDKERGEKSTPCPHCALELPESVLHCPSCKNDLPYCVTTGKHMILSDWSECPSCAFPTLHSAAVAYLATAADKSCCMCNAPIAMQDLRKLSEQQARAKLSRPTAAEEKEAAAAAAAEGGAAGEAGADDGAGPPAPRQGGMMSGGAAQQRGPPQQLAAVDIEPVFNKK